MNSTIITSTTLAASLTALTLSIWGLVNKDNIAGHQPTPSVATPTSPIETVSVSSTPETQEHNNTQEMESIIQYLTTIEARMTELSNKVASLENASPAIIAATHQGTPSHTTAHANNQMAPPVIDEELEQRFSQLEDFYLAGVSDANTTTIVDDAFMQAVDEKRLEGSINTDLNCHDTLCKISASHENPLALDNYIHKFASIIPWGMAAEIKYEAAENGAVYTTFYVSREEDLPPLRQP